MIRTLFILPILLTLAASPILAAPGDDRVKSIEAKIEPAEAKPGQTVTYKITIKLFPGFHTYPTVQPDPTHADDVSKIVFADYPELIFVEPVADPPGAKAKPGPKGGLLSYYEDEATFEAKAVVAPDAIPGEPNIKPKRAQMTVCDETNCVPIVRKLSAPLKIVAGSVPVEAKYKEAVDKALATRGPVPKSLPPKEDPTVSPPPPNNIDNKNPPAPPVTVTTTKSIKLVPNPDYEQQLMSVLDKPVTVETGNGTESTGFGTFLLTAALWGLITLLTPCVFPMVPITVSVFLKQSEKQGTNPVTQAAVYALTIVTVLGISALLLLEVFRGLSVNPWMNIGLGVLFVVFALSLFGMYDITVPNWMVNFTSKHEGGGGYLGTVFMGLTFSLISFTCVAPFLGGFAGLSASGNYSRFQLACGALAFAASFAAPFFVLALFPSLMKKLPKSGGWMNTIKVVMGFLEFAAALKFFRTAELRWLDQPVVFSYDIVLALWIGTLVVMGLYLFGLFRLPHDHNPHEHVGPPRMLFGVLSIAIAIYLTPALFGSGEHRNRPRGTLYAWVDAFLLPETVGESEWSGDLKGSLRAANQNGELVFIDFTGVTCTNCRLNEDNVFTKPEVRALMQRYRLVQLYTDTVPEALYVAAPNGDKRETDGDANRRFEETYFGTLQLPLYVIMKPEPGGKATVLGVYAEGKINRVDLFVDFLRKPLMK
jgi:thiol:disulfide interchange protein